MARLRRDDDAGPTPGRHLPELLEHDCGAVEIYLKNRFWRCLTGRHASGVDKADDLADARRPPDQCTHRLARGHVDRRNAHLVASVGHDFGCGVRVRLAAVGEQDVLTDSDAARDG